MDLLNEIFAAMEEAVLQTVNGDGDAEEASSKMEAAARVCAAVLQDCSQVKKFIVAIVALAASASNTYLVIMLARMAVSSWLRLRVLKVSN